MAVNLPEPMIDLRDPLPDDVAVEVFLDLSVARALADRLRAEGAGGDTIADRA